jgi:hypothetical protein
MMLRRNLAILAASAGCLATAFIALPASAATTTATTKPYVCPDNAYTAHPEDGRFVGEPVNIRNGPATACATTGSGSKSHKLTYHCYKYNSADGYTWTHLKDITTGKSGWARDDLLKNGGSSYAC